jgi:hypothetical protein
MAAVIENIIKSYLTTEAVTAYVRVKKSSTGVAIAGAGEVGIGVTLSNAANGDPVAVRLFNGYGTCFMKAGAAITANTLVYGIAAGKIDDAVASTNAGAPLGYAETAATADGDIIEVLLTGRVAPEVRAGAAQAAVVTTASTTTTPYGYATQAQADALVTIVNEVRTTLINAGLWKGAA